METGKLIKQMRKDRKMTQKELAEKSGVAEITIRKLEKGQSNPTVETIKKICRVFDQPYILLLNKEDFEKEEKESSKKIDEMHTQIKKDNGILEITKSITHLGYNLVEVTSESKENELDFFLLFDHGNIPMSINELKEIKKEHDLYLEYLINKFIKSKPLQNRKEDYTYFINQIKDNQKNK